MDIMRVIVFPFVHAVIILAVSFFVLVVARKVESPWLRVFGLVVAILLWIAAALVFGGIGREPQGMAGGPMQHARCPMMESRMERMPSEFGPGFGGPKVPPMPRRHRFDGSGNVPPPARDDVPPPSPRAAE